MEEDSTSKCFLGLVVVVVALLVEAADASGMKRERDEADDKEAGAAAATRHCGAMAHSSNGEGGGNGGRNHLHHPHEEQEEQQQQRSNKYDRQLRIWGDHGQAALERATVCLLNCGPTGTEALKNLVLGGVGSVTVVDGRLVQEADLGNNFLLSWEDLGQPRAKSVSALLREMNDSVVIDHVEAVPEGLLESDPGFFARFTLVIATQVPERSLLVLDDICRRYGVMLLIARSYGLTGYVRISLKEHTVIESKPDNLLDDLRLHKPWPELKQLVDEFHIDTTDSLVHKHIPFGIILLKAVEQWKAKHGGMLPSNSKERSEFKALLASKKQAEDEDNYKEALASSYKVWAPPTISSEVQAILDDDAAKVDSGSPDFWILVAALKRFIENEGEGDLPLDGSIPDMHSFTEYYMQLQRCYQARAEADISAVEAHVRSTLKQIGREPYSISRATIKHFCKNSRNIWVFRYTPLADEYGPKTGAKLHKYLPFEGDSNAAIYLLFRAVDKFAEKYNRYPGVIDEEFEDDVPKLKTITVGLVSELGLDGAAVSDDLIYEFCRFGAAEIHCVGAVAGGIASQEAIKIVTKQFTPVPGTLIYNAISSTTTVLQL